MAFFGMFLLMVFFFIFLGSLFLLVLSTVFFFLAKNKQKKNQKWKIIKYLSIPFMVISTIPSIIVGILLVLGLYFCTLTPKNYVEKPEISFQDEGFVTKDNERYLRLDYRCDELYQTSYSPQFSYKSGGRFNRINWFNIYQTTNDDNISLYFGAFNEVSEVMIFAKEDEYEQVTNYYEKNYQWELNPLDSEDNQKLITIFERYRKCSPNLVFHNYYGNYYHAKSSDCLVYVYNYSFNLTDDHAYLLVDQDYLDGYNYYGFELTKDEEIFVRDFLFSNYSYN